MHVKAKTVALGGLLLALTIVFMALGSFIETSTLFLLAAASFFVGIVIREFGLGAGGAFYLAAVLLGLSLVPALAACGSGGGGTEAGGTVYTPSFVRCEAGMEQISAGCADGETLYILGTAENDGRTAIRRVALDGTTAPLENYVPLSGPEAAENFVNINNLRPGADGTLWVTEELTSTTFQLPEGFDEASGDKWDYQVTETTRVQRQLDGTGQELRRVDLEEQIGRASCRERV